ncbi:MAG: branched-chain amino acid aminotransferase [Bacteroidetes bacterium]|nr:branched-chain amino acid aminotransferase [Bacteroidota bacterium]
MKNLNITRTGQSRLDSIDYGNLGFGKYFSDHMFVLDYADDTWGEPRIEPYGPMDIEPANCTLHYGQTIFEGMKAYRSAKGGINLFRPYMNAKRLNRSAAAVCIPAMDEETFVDGIRELVKFDHAFIPRERGHSLYIRPFTFGTGNFLGVHASSTYRFMIITSPVASYYPEGLNPVRIKVDEEHIRAVRGGLGQAKTAANYAASLYAGMQAKSEGFAQVLFLEAVSRQFVDEIGAMNIMFIIDDELITPPLSQGSILPGVTRDSVLHLARDWGMKVSERSIGIDEIAEAHRDGRLQESFGTGTAAVISPVGEFVYRGESLVINERRIGPFAQRFYDTITGIQYGEIDDPYGWLEHIPM